jgi:hypothetical protein
VRPNWWTCVGSRSTTERAPCTSGESRRALLAPIQSSGTSYAPCGGSSANRSPSLLRSGTTSSIHRQCRLIRKRHFPYQLPQVAYTAFPDGRGRRFNPYSAHHLDNVLFFKHFLLYNLSGWYSLMVQPDATAARLRRSICRERTPRGTGLRCRGSMAERHESASAAGEARRTRCSTTWHLTRSASSLV